jgi:hypothetical protein
MNPPIKKLKEEFTKVVEMKNQLSLVPFFSVGRLLEIDFRELKKCLVEHIENYKESITRWASTTMLKNIEELYKTIQSTLESIKVKADSSEKLVEI